MILVWRNGTLCFNPAPLQVRAKLRAVERAGRSARFEKWDPMPEDRAAAPIASKRQQG